MLKYVSTSLIFVFALFILIVSIFRTASSRIAFEKAPLEIMDAYLLQPTSMVNGFNEIDYRFPYPGRIVPGNPLWFLKAFRDKIWIMVTSNPAKKAELNLLFADKRLAISYEFYKKNNYTLALSTISKAEKYLEESMNQVLIAKAQGMKSSDFYMKLSMSSLKHREVLEAIGANIPSDMRPLINKMIDYPRKVYETTVVLLREMNFEAPKSPFEN